MLGAAMDTITVEYSEVNGADFLCYRASQMIPEELWGPNFKHNAMDIFETADVVYVAHIDEEVIGCICLTRFQGCPDDPGNMEGWARCWYLKPEYRGQRIGLHLLELVIKYAKRHPNFYKRYIFAENVGDFLKKVNEAPNKVLVDRARSIARADGSKLDIYWIWLG